MKNDHIPKILIFSQTFNEVSGGGITLTNIFTGYPKEKLAVLTYPFMLTNVSFVTCDNYYQIGRDEYRWRYPLYLFKKTFDSGLIKPKTGSPRVDKVSLTFKNRISSSILAPLLRWTGFSHCVSEIVLSEKLISWLQDYSPDVLYLQISNRESILFSLQLIEFLDIPVIIHMMDDWPSTISSVGPMKSHWKKIIDSEFSALLDRVDLCLSISEAMSEEYLERYGRKFIPFHNPINPERFNNIRRSLKADPKHFQILYLGRIGTANQSSLLKFAQFISEFRHDGLNIHLDIYTKDTDNQYVRKIEKLGQVRIRQAIGYDEVPNLMQEYDLLLLPLDFTESGLRFSRLSMPTKATEYMISGVPMLVFAPSNTAISRFCTAHSCGHCISSENVNEIAEGLSQIIDDSLYRKALAERAGVLARQLFDTGKVRNEFKDLLINLVKSRAPKSK